MWTFALVNHWGLSGCLFLALVRLRAEEPSHQADHSSVTGHQFSIATSIENRLHWVRDVNLGEECCRVKRGAAPQVLAALRNLVSGLLRLAGHSNMAAALRHYGWKAGNAVQLLAFPCRDN